MKSPKEAVEVGRKQSAVDASEPLMWEDYVGVDFGDSDMGMYELSQVLVAYMGIHELILGLAAGTDEEAVVVIVTSTSDLGNGDFGMVE